MDNEMLKKIVAGLVVVAIIVIGGILLVGKKNQDLKDTVTYDGEKYVLLEYKQDVFTYNFISNEEFYDEDDISPMKHDKWDVVYFGGDLFVLDTHVEDATTYYQDDNNYEWFVVYEDEETKKSESLAITKDEIDFLYGLDDAKKDTKVSFDDIEMFVDVVKISKDGFLEGTINLVRYKNSWYYKTEVMSEDDKEYVIELPSSLNSKLIDLLKK